MTEKQEQAEWDAQWSSNSSKLRFKITTIRVAEKTLSEATAKKILSQFGRMTVQQQEQADVKVSSIWQNEYIKGIAIGLGFVIFFLIIFLIIWLLRRCRREKKK